MQAQPTAISRTGITAADKDIGTIPRYPCEGAEVVRLGAICSVAGATLKARVVFWDSMGYLVGVSASVVFTADATPLFCSLYLSSPSPDAWFPIGGPAAFSIHVDSVSAGAWTLSAMAL